MPPSFNLSWRGTHASSVFLKTYELLKSVLLLSGLVWPRDVSLSLSPFSVLLRFSRALSFFFRMSCVSNRERSHSSGPASILSRFFYPSQTFDPDLRNLSGGEVSFLSHKMVSFLPLDVEGVSSF